MGHVLLMFLIGLSFSVVAPLLVPFSVAWFMFAWVAWRHNLTYVYQRKYESGGLMWPFVFNRICVCLGLFQVRGCWSGCMHLGGGPCLCA